MADVINPYPSPTARLGPVEAGSSAADDFIFNFALNRDGVAQLAPRSVLRTYSSNYAPVPLALSAHSPDEWKSNNPTDIVLDFEIVGGGQTGVDSSLRKLRKFMRKDRRTGEPPDLAFQMGRKVWFVRVHRMEVNPLLWNQSVEEQRVKVSLTLRTTEAES